MTDLEQAINKVIEDVCMRVRELPVETRYDGRNLDEAVLNLAQALKLLCQARSEVLTSSASTSESAETKLRDNRQILAKELVDRFAEENFRNLANL